MLNNNHTLELNQKDLELIESALHTQQKILSVQSEAGGQGAKERLTDLKQLMKRITRQAPTRPVITGTEAVGQNAPPCQGMGLIARTLFC